MPPQQPASGRTGAEMPEVTRAGTFILWLLKQVGKQYLYGAQVKLLEEDLGNPYAHADMKEWDCGDLVKGGLWAANVPRVGTVPIAAFDPSWMQYEAARHIPIEVAKTMPGALVFVQGKPERPHGISHVAVVVAKDIIVEARGKRYGVTIGAIRPSFTLAAKVDELYA